MRVNLETTVTSRETFCIVIDIDLVIGRRFINRWRFRLLGEEDKIQLDLVEIDRFMPGVCTNVETVFKDETVDCCTLFQAFNVQIVLMTSISILLMFWLIV